jgi:hypothetical protein
MSELVPYEGHTARQNKNLVTLPRSNEELFMYFSARENQDPGLYKGYAELAAAAADAVEEARRYGKTDEVHEVDIALLPERSEGVYLNELTHAGRELMDVVIIANDLEPVVDEGTEDNPYGRILWQSRTPGLGINLLETRWRDAKGGLVKFTALSHLPDDLVTTRLTAAEAPHFYTTGEIEKEVLDLYKDLAELPVIEIDETELVKNYFRKAA